MALEPGPKTDETRTTHPWPVRVAAGLIVLSIAAILLAVFLPRERYEASPGAGPTTDAVAANTQAQQMQQPQMQQPRMQWNSEPQTQVAPQIAQSQTPQQQAYPSQTQQQAQQYQGQQQTQQQAQQQTQQPQAQTSTFSGRAATSPMAGQTQAAAGGAQSPTYAGAAPAGTVTSSGPQQSANPAPGPLFSAAQAEQVVAEVERLQGTPSGAASGEMLPLFIAPLRQYDNPVKWAQFKGDFPEWRRAFEEYGAQGVSSEGLRELEAVILRSRTGVEAADMLERIGARQALPTPVRRAILYWLANSTTPSQAFSGINAALGAGGYTLTPGANAYLDTAIRGQYGR